jgi:ketol-acid reductoisomerase
MMVTKIYPETDAALNVLKGKKIAVIGYGNQGRAQALCIHDSGMNVTVGARKGGESWDMAQADGLKVADIPDAVKGADIVMILLPDVVRPRVYKEQIAPNLKEGAALEFAHGFAITFKLITPPENCDVIMVAPKSPGRMVRQTFLEGFGVPSLIAVEQDASGRPRTSPWP